MPALVLEQQEVSEQKKKKKKKPFSYIIPLVDRFVPASFSVLLQLPSRAQPISVLGGSGLKTPLTNHSCLCCTGEEHSPGTGFANFCDTCLERVQAHRC